MVELLDDNKIKSLSPGANTIGVRDYNGRLLLSLINRYGAQTATNLAEIANLSVQTASVILRKLEKDGLLVRGEPIRGKVGKPSIPMDLAPDGVFSFGLKVGRRSADLLLMDFKGQPRQQLQTTYSYPMPENVFGFLEAGIAELQEGMKASERKRLCGIGIAAPFELWKWHELVGAPAEKFEAWKDIVFRDRVAEFSDLPVSLINDATAACRAEQVYGQWSEFRDYAYFFIGSFVGGGIVLNYSVFDGHQGNAGALGSLRTTGPLGEGMQLIDVASIHLLEYRLLEAGLDPDLLWNQPQDWSTIAKYVDPWLGQTAQELAKASLSTCSVIDFEAIVIDGAFPPEVRSSLVERTRRYIATQDTRGLISPRIEEGSIGENARAIGAATEPIFNRFLLNTNAGVPALKI